MKNKNDRVRQIKIIFPWLFILWGLAPVSEANETMNADNGVEYHLEDVIVTAERRESNIQKTPISITTFTTEEIKDLNITQVPDLGLRIPNLTVGNSSTFSTPDIYLRGVGTRDFTIGNDLSIGFYIDDVYIGRAGNVFVDLFDLERIEVLKGPQGTLWGRNAVAGAINVITTKPTDEFETKHQLTYGNYDLFQLTGTVSNSLVDDTFLGRFSYSVRDREGYSDNVFDGNDVGDAENISVRGSLQYLETDDVDFLLSLDYSKDRPTGIAFDSKIVGAPANGLGHQEPEGPFTVNLDTPGHEHQDTYGISGKLNWDLETLSFVSISAFRGYKVNQSDDTDGISLLLANFKNKINQTQFTQEFRLLNKPDGKLKWLIGAFVFHEEADNEITVDSSGFGAGDFISTNLSSIVSNSYSLFGQATYSFTKRLSATTGARYTYEDKDFNIRRDGATGLGDAGFPLTSLDKGWQAFTPKVGLEFQQTDDLLWYASISRGFRSGGFNASQATAPTSFNPEYLLAYEMGLKSSWLNRRLQTNLAAFYYDHTDLQVTRIARNLSVVTDNAAKAEEKGVEAEIIVYPVQGLDINLSLAYLDARYLELVNGTKDLSGNSVNHSPTFSSYFGIQYTMPLKDFGFIHIGAEHQYQSEFFFTETNESILSQGQYHNINARVGFDTFDEKFALSFFVNNLTDEVTANSGVDLRTDLGIVNYALNPPRTYGIQFKYNY